MPISSPRNPTDLQWFCHPFSLMLKEKQPHTGECELNSEPLGQICSESGNRGSLLCLGEAAAQNRKGWWPAYFQETPQVSGLQTSHPEHHLPQPCLSVLGSPHGHSTYYDATIPLNGHNCGLNVGIYLQT